MTFTYPCGRTWCDCTMEGTACAKVLDPVKPKSPYGRPADDYSERSPDLRPKCHIIPEATSFGHALALCGQHTTNGLPNPEGIWVDGRCAQCGKQVCFDCERAWYCK